MILELADIRITPGKQVDFDAAIELGLTSVLGKVPGCRGYLVQKGIEHPERYLLMVYWDSVEAHNEGFRKSPAFEKWRAIVSPFFAVAPQVEHFDLLIESG
jgi:heme-degrading monooxygenase HmoA